MRLDFGPSYKFPSREVRDIILTSLPVSLELGVYAILLALVIGIPIGTVAALKQDSIIDRVVMSLAMTPGQTS